MSREPVVNGSAGRTPADLAAALNVPVTVAENVLRWYVRKGLAEEPEPGRFVLTARGLRIAFDLVSAAEEVSTGARR